MAERISVLIVDDHFIVRKGLLALLSECEDIEVAGEAADGREAVTRAGELRPDIVLMDL
ncbi:MAG TPA: response regulator transcription factor, partial [Thermoanaerobaculia bacterium]|nr:response regulator transcription factor [Thermoanaerobaculia bacterium]